MMHHDPTDAQGARPANVLAVLVVYERDLDDVEAWPALQQMLAASHSMPGEALRLTHLLIYDNSALPRARPSVPSSLVTWVHDPRNGGTAAAYAHAERLAPSVGASWLLLLDHDTRIPPTLLQSAHAALVQTAPETPAALLPWVMHGSSVVSPARITTAGTVRPLVRGAPLAADWHLTGIASGSFLCLHDVEGFGRMPRGLWLDYVDHWIFARLALRGRPVALIDCTLQHDLSVTHIDRLGNARLDGILAAESVFVSALPWPARAVHPWRLFARALRVAQARPGHAWTIMKHAVHRRRDAGRPRTDGDQPVSVVMAVYNGERFLAPQVESVLAQLQPRDELLIIDDASTDSSPHWLAQLDDARVHIVRQPCNAGVLKSFEAGLRRARHELVFLCDQDDLWLPGKRDAVVVEFERDTRALIVVSDAEVIDAQDRVVAPSFMATRHGFKGRFHHTLVRNRYLGCAMAVRRELIDAALPIPAGVPMHDMWLGSLGSVLGQVRYIARPLIRYRRHGGNLSPSQRQTWSRMVRWRWALLRAVVNRIGRIVLGIHRRRSSRTSKPPSLD